MTGWEAPAHQDGTGQGQKPSGEIQPLMWKDRSETPRGHLALLKFKGSMRNGERRDARVEKCIGDTQVTDPMAQKAALKENYRAGGKWALSLQ